MTEPLTYDADSARRCLACGHAEPHNAEGDARRFECHRCPCSEEDRLIADYRAEVLRLREWLEGIRDLAVKAASIGEEFGYVYIEDAATKALAGEVENYQYRTRKEG